METIKKGVSIMPQNYTPEFKKKIVLGKHGEGKQPGMAHLLSVAKKASFHDVSSEWDVVAQNMMPAEE